MLRPICMMTQTPLNAMLSTTPYAFMLTLGPDSAHQRTSDFATTCEIFGKRLEDVKEDVVVHCPLVFVDPLDPSSSAFSSAAFASTLNTKDQHLQCHDDPGTRTSFVPAIISILFGSVGGEVRTMRCRTK